MSAENTAPDATTSIITIPSSHTVTSRPPAEGPEAKERRGVSLMGDLRRLFGLWRRQYAPRTTVTAPKRYQYKPLHRKGRHIRVLDLLPGEWDDPVCVRLQTISFKGKATLDFEALSYTWGSSENPATVFVDQRGKHGHYSTIEVTQNLFEALIHLRHQDRNRKLWIDAICINQADVTERGHQVALMADLYSRASKVAVWLGPEADDSHIAMDCIKQISKHVSVLHIDRLVALTEDFDWGDPKVPLPFNKRQIQALGRLFGRPWFERLWVWQEVHLGKDRCHVVCGIETLEWTKLRNAILCIWRKPVDVVSLSYTNELTTTMEKLVRIVHGSTRDFTHSPLKTLSYLRSQKCADPRDRIYDGLTMARGGFTSFELTPDYIKSVQTTYEEAAVRTIQVLGDFDILIYAGSSEQMSGLASWIPDWSRAPDTYERIYYANSSVRTSAPRYCASIVLGQGLTIKGHIVATVNQVESFIDPPRPDILAIMLAKPETRTAHVFDFILRLFARHLITNEPQRYLDLFFNSSFAEAYVPQSALRPSRDACTAGLTALFGGSDSEGISRWVGDSLYTLLVGRSFFLTRMAYSVLRRKPLNLAMSLWR